MAGKLRAHANDGSKPRKALLMLDTSAFSAK